MREPSSPTVVADAGASFGLGARGEGGSNDVVLRLNFLERLAKDTSPASFCGRFNGGILGHPKTPGVEFVEEDICS